ncbi:HNH endonuclease domain-containing protein [Ditylenchus destructor]|nr:HNH endonuclease domain-containing protein [Ditylenchus destructor]
MRTLVLNAGYEPLAIVSFKRALVLVMNDKASVIERIEGDPVWGSRGAYDRPAVIILSRYVRVPNSRRVPVTRRGVLRRDNHRCGYCGKAASTIDHVMPRSRGGADSWENLVACYLFSELVPVLLVIALVASQAAQARRSRSTAGIAVDTVTPSAGVS